jgi:hypothetical protein
VGNDVARDPRYPVDQDGPGPELIVPVVGTGRGVGTGDVERDAAGAFDGAEIQRYGRLADALRPLWTGSHRPAGTGSARCPGTLRPRRP